MARLYLATGNIKPLYVVDHAVGTGCSNKRDDVFLVQFFLKVASEGPHRVDYTPTGRSPLRCDGMWGPNSQAFLNQYIAVNSSHNPNSPLTLDGRVDPVVGGRFFGPRVGNLYTILALNVSYLNVRGPEALRDITIDPLFPRDLRPSLKIAD